MKLLLLSLLSLVALSDGGGGSSNKLTGEISVEQYCKDAEKWVEFSCEWYAKNRRRLRNSRELSLSAAFEPKCELEICDQDGDNCGSSIDLKAKLPEDWEYVITKTEHSDTDDVYYRLETILDLDDYLSELEVKVTLELLATDDPKDVLYLDSDGVMTCP